MSLLTAVSLSLLSLSLENGPRTMEEQDPKKEEDVTSSSARLGRMAVNDEVTDDRENTSSTTTTTTTTTVAAVSVEESAAADERAASATSPRRREQTSSSSSPASHFSNVRSTVSVESAAKMNEMASGNGTGFDRAYPSSAASQYRSNLEALGGSRSSADHYSESTPYQRRRRRPLRRDGESRRYDADDSDVSLDGDRLRNRRRSREEENGGTSFSQAAREVGQQNTRDVLRTRDGRTHMRHHVYSWGRGEDGQLGLGDTNDQYQPVFIESLKDRRVAQIACGSGHTVVLTEEKGEVYTWGRGDDGRLGHGDNGWKYVPRLVQALRGKHVCQVTCGSYHTAAVTKSGALYTWGGGMYGKLGHGNETGHAVPCHVQTLIGKRIIQVACGSRHTVALAASSDVFSWGDRENGVSGHGETDGHQYFPKVVGGVAGKGIWQITACGFHTACLSRSNSVFSWGEGKFGRLGHGNELNKIVPNKVLALEGRKITEVSCGGFHTAAITDSGVLFTWGGGEHGQLGHGDKVNKMVPCVVGALADSRIVQITCGWSHSVALSQKGQVFTWGNGDHGKLGHGDTLRKSLPQLVQGLVGKHVVRVASYNEHTSALTNPDGSLTQMRATTTSFLRHMRKLVNNADFHDVVFVVEGKPIYAHRAILAVRCEFFMNLFKSGMRESDEMEVKITDFRYPIFLALIEYIYTDLVDVTPEVAIELFVVADMYMLTRLKLLCEMVVQQGINIPNAASLFRTADEAGATKLRKICLDFTIRHFDGVTKSNAFKSLSREQILEVLMNR